MSKKVVLVGHCGPDSSFLRMAVARVNREYRVLAADDAGELHAVMKEEKPDLLLVNRELPYGFDQTMGIDLIKKLRAGEADVKTMLVSNYADAQATAVAAGALPGFGKRELGTPRVVKVLREALGE
ncbi:MAG: response regulator [Tepidisphaeraceae bacterium]